MNNTDRGDLIRLIGLGLTIVLEAFVLLSVLLNVEPIPGELYQRVSSVAIFVLPSIIGLLCKRIEGAILLAILPFWVLAVIYLFRSAPVWNINLLTLGVLAERVASVSVLLAFLSILGWLLRRVLIRQPIFALGKKS